MGRGSRKGSKLKCKGKMVEKDRVKQEKYLLIHVQRQLAHLQADTKFRTCHPEMVIFLKIVSKFGKCRIKTGMWRRLGGCEREEIGALVSQFG
jgi:hypothetical protein